MSEFLNRELRTGENVHHINGDRSDNRIQNLELWTVNQPSGQRVKDKILWAVGFLGEYGYEVSKPKITSNIHENPELINQ